MNVHVKTHVQSPMKGSRACRFDRKDMPERDEDFQMVQMLDEENM